MWSKRKLLLWNIAQLITFSAVSSFSKCIGELSLTPKSFKNLFEKMWLVSPKQNRAMTKRTTSLEQTAYQTIATKRGHNDSRFPLTSHLIADATLKDPLIHYYSSGIREKHHVLPRLTNCFHNNVKFSSTTYFWFFNTLLDETSQVGTRETQYKTIYF